MDWDACSSCTGVTNTTRDSFENPSEMQGMFEALPILKARAMEPSKVTKLRACNDDSMESPLIPVQKNLKQRFGLSAITMNEEDGSKQRFWSQTEDSMSESEASVPLIPLISSGETVTTVPSTICVTEQNQDESEVDSQSLLPQFSTAVSKMADSDECQNTQDPAYDQRKKSFSSSQPDFNLSQMSCFSFLDQPSDSQVLATSFSPASKQKSLEDIGVPSSGSTITEILDINHQDQQTQEREQKIVARILKLHYELDSSIESSKECPDSTTTGKMRRRLTCVNNILIQLKQWHKSELEQLSRDVRTSNKSLGERFRLRTSIQNLRQRQKTVLELFYKQKQLSLALKSAECRVTNDQDVDNLTSSGTSKDSTKLENIKGEGALSQAFRNADDASRLQPQHYTETYMKISKPSKVVQEDASTITESESSYKRWKISQANFAVVGTDPQGLTTVSTKSLNQSWSGTTNERCTNYHRPDLGHRSNLEKSVELDIGTSLQSINKISTKTIVNVEAEDPVGFQQAAGVKRKVQSESLENLFAKRIKDADKTPVDNPAGGKFTEGTQQIDKDHFQIEHHVSTKEQEVDDGLNCSSPCLISYNQLTKDGQKENYKISEHGRGTSTRGDDKQDDFRGDTELGSTTHNQKEVAVKSGNNSSSHFLVPQKSTTFQSPVLPDSSAKNASISPSGTSMSSDVFVVKAKELQRRVDKKIEIARLSQIQSQRSNLESLGVKDSTMTEISLGEKPSVAAGGLQEDEEDEDDFHDERLNSMIKSFDWPELNTSAVQGDTVQSRYKEKDLWLSKNSTTLGVMPAPKSDLKKMCLSLKKLVSAGKLKPGQDNLTLTAKGKTERASLTSKGLIEKRDGVVFSTPVQWLSSALSGVKVSRKRAYQEVSYNGQQLFNICQEKNHSSSGFALKSDSTAKTAISCDGKYSQRLKTPSKTTYGTSVTNSTTHSHTASQHSANLPISIISTQPQMKYVSLSRPVTIKQTNRLSPVNTRRVAPQSQGFSSSNIIIQDTRIPKSKRAQCNNTSSTSPRATTLMTSSSVQTTVTTANARPQIPMLVTVSSLSTLASSEAGPMLATKQGSRPQVSSWTDEEREQKSCITNYSQTLPTIVSVTEDSDEDNKVAKSSKIQIVDETRCSASKSDHNMMKTTRTEEEFLADLLYQCKVKLIEDRELINDNDLPENFWTTDYAKLKISQSLWASVDVWN